MQAIISRVPINWVLRKSGNLVFGMFGLIFLYNIRVDVTEHLSRSIHKDNSEITIRDFVLLFRN